MIQFAKCLMIAAIVSLPAGSAQGQLTLTKGARIGEADNANALNNPYALAVDTARVYVVEPANGAVRIFSREGKVLHTIGGAAKAPNEMMLAYAVLVQPGGGLMIFDRSHRRFKYYSPDGVLLSDREVPGRLRGLTLLRYYPLSDGSFVSLGLGQGNPAGGINEIVLVKRDSIAHTLRSFQDSVQFLSMNNPPGGQFVRSPVARDPLLATNPSADRFVIVDRDGGENHVVTLYDVEGQVLRKFDYPVGAVTFAPAARAAFIESLAEKGLNANLFSSMGDARSAMDAVVPNTLAPVTAAVLSDDGSLWLRGPDDGIQETIRWRYLHPEGRVLGEIDLPRASRILLAESSKIYVVERGTFGAPIIQEYLISNSPAAPGRSLNRP